ncbi:MAG: elongation factor P maturation arginine rhamnosyltransferase EarP [Betaproteobacteria bacterium]|jgi:Uncharacterized protein conserved in bacteria|nr:elongation factor P maturation arginine rhamnosyltransferase EarP [Betaproteobacteria bacterium]
MAGAWWIFCRVIDNFGDAGVSWRLSCQLSRHLGHPVDLVIDDWQTLARLEPALGDEPLENRAITTRGVRVWSWRRLEEQPEKLETSDPQVLVSGFSCELPEAVRFGLQQWKVAPLWILFEYLSAEAWVDDCHARPSPISSYPGQRYFYFPGFTRYSGGLLREPGLLDDRDDWQQNHSRPGWVAQAQRWLTLWAYPEAPWLALHEAICQDPELWGWCLFEGAALTNCILEHGLASIPVRVIPFQTQGNYDVCLWDADLNLVRGEDSFVRAQWAGKPLLWHIYPQEDGSHWNKLNAFLDIYLDGVEHSLAMAIRALFLAWNGKGAIVHCWQQVREQWGLWELHARYWSRTLAMQPDLVTRLVEFVENKLE